MVAAGRSHAVLFIAALGLLLNVVLNFVLVPRQGILGAARATFATELMVALAALGTLIAAGASPLEHGRWKRWIVGPIAFVAARALTSVIAGNS